MIENNNNDNIFFCSDNNKCVYIFMREGKKERERES